MMSRGFRGWAGGGRAVSSSMSEFDVETDRARGDGEIECFVALGSSPSSCGDVESGTANETFRVCGEGRRLCPVGDLCGSSGISVSWDENDESDGMLEADILCRSAVGRFVNLCSSSGSTAKETFRMDPEDGLLWWGD